MTLVSHHPGRGGYRTDIDGLRAIAVLAVLGYHAFPDAVGGGFVGVDVFLVISGFLITSIIRDGLDAGRFTLHDFYARRIRRIFPSLAVVLAVVMVIGWFVLVPGDYATLGRHVVGGAAFVSNLVLWREAGYFDADAMFKPLLHLWSLGIEEQFYLLWPPLLILARRMRINLLALTLVVAALSFVASVWLLPAHPSAAFYLPFTRFWELMVGGLLAFASTPAGTDRSGGRFETAMASTGLALVVIAAFAFDDAQAFPGWRALLPTLGTALLIQAGPGNVVSRRLLSMRALVAIGLVSYPLYLWHWPLLSLARIDAGDEVSDALRWSLLAASGVLAWLTWRWVERPFRFGRLRARAVPILVATMLVVAAAGGGLMVAKGFESRAGEPVRRYSSYSYPFRASSREGSCSLVDASQPVEFPAVCVDPDTGDGRPLVVLWGDSHAAMFYAGLRAAGGGRFRIAQFTRSGCRPFFDVGPPICRSGNDAVMRRIETMHPDSVILFANWKHVRFNGAQEMLQQLEPTIIALKRAGVPRIVVMGPAPAWQGKLPIDLIKLYDRRPFLHVPSRMRFGLEAVSIDLDATLRATLGTRNDLQYFSVLLTLCDVRGCMTYVGDDPNVLTTWDYGHLTEPAAQYVAERLLSLMDDLAGLQSADAAPAAR